MIAASITARNIAGSVESVTKGVGNLVTPVLSASAAGVAAALGIIAWYEIRNLEATNNPTFEAAFGDEPGWLAKLLAPLQGPNSDTPGYDRLTQQEEPPTPEQRRAVRQQQSASWRLKLSQLRTAIGTELLKLSNNDII